MPCDRNSASQVSRGTASIRTSRPNSRAKVSPISCGAILRAASSSTMRTPFHVSSSSSAPVLPTSSVAIIGTGFSSGCRKLGMMPVSRAGRTSHNEFSINHAARRKATGIGRVPSSHSIIPSCDSRLVCVAWAPIVERQTTRDGRASPRALRRAAIVCRTSGNPGEGSKFGGIIANTASAPANARLNASASLMSASAISHPCCAQMAPFPALRTTARIFFPAASSWRATTPPTWPVIPVITIICSPVSPMWEPDSRRSASSGRRQGRLPPDPSDSGSPVASGSYLSIFRARASN